MPLESFIVDELSAGSEAEPEAEKGAATECWYCAAGEPLCDRCAGRLFILLERIDPAIARLDRIAMLEADSVGGAFDQGRGGTRGQLTDATLDADELDKAATVWARHTMAGMEKPPEWRGFAGPYLVACRHFIAKQPWARELVNDLGPLVAAIDLKWPDPDEPPRPRQLPIPCPGCDQVGTLALYPPRFFRQPIAIQCSGTRTDSGRLCGWQCQEDAMDWMRRIVEHDQAASKALSKSGWKGWILTA